MGEGLDVPGHGQENPPRRGSPLAMEVQRTLVKSPPELWAEISDVEALTRHLAAFGEITITRVEPESTVAWEGERASGTVELSASGWGTKVTLSAEPVAVAVAPEPEPAPEPETAPAPVSEPVAVAEAPRRRWRFWARNEVPAPPAPTPVPVPPTPTPHPGAPAPPDPNPPPIAFDPSDTEAVLTKVLDDLGQAHHRPFQR
jgi:hypothetical protein